MTGSIEFWQQFIWLDYLTIVFLLALFVLGIMRGFVKEFVGLLFWFLAFWLGFNYYIEVGQLDGFNQIDSLRLRYVLVFCLILLLTLLAGKLFAKGLTALLGVTGLGFINRLLGGLFALLKGAVVIAFALIIVTKVPWIEANIDTLQGSPLLTLIEQSAAWLKLVLPPEMQTGAGEAMTSAAEVLTE